jgi:hypothetical protein
MTFLTDLRGMSEAALNQLTERFGDLPRPLLAAIGAGDFAVEQLAELRAALGDTLEHQAAGPVGNAKGFATDLPHRMQDAASEVMESVQKLAADAPALTQHLVEQLPARVADIREALSAEQLKGAVDGYAQLAAIIYGSLAERGDRKLATVMATTEHGAAAATTAAASAAEDATQAAAETARKVADNATAVADAVAATDIEASAAKSSAARAERDAGRRAAAAAAESEQVSAETTAVIAAQATAPAAAVLRPTATPREKTPTPRPASRSRRPTVVPAVEKPAKNRATRAAGAPRKAATPAPRAGGRSTAEPTTDSAAE